MNIAWRVTRRDRPQMLWCINLRITGARTVARAANPLRSSLQQDGLGSWRCQLSRRRSTVTQADAGSFLAMEKALSRRHDSCRRAHRSNSPGPG
jgi:hypothetical protein